jgi:hypothetical protein
LYDRKFVVVSAPQPAWHKGLRLLKTSKKQEKTRKSKIAWQKMNSTRGETVKIQTKKAKLPGKK